jgi:hypothetical protein
MNSTGIRTADAVHLPNQVGLARQCLRYVLHLAAVYVIVRTTTLWLAGRVHDTLLPLVQHRPPAESSFQFVFSHLFVFSFFPAVLIAFAFAQWYAHRIALYVWIVPLAMLVFKFFTFPSTLFERQFAAAFHEYFGGGFLIPEFRSYQELFRLAASPDMRRGMEQLNFTAPLYAAIGYSLGTWLGMRFEIPKLTEAWRKAKPARTPSE